MKLLILAPATHYEEGWFGELLLRLGENVARVAAEQGWQVLTVGLQDCSDHDWHEALAAADAVVLLGGHDVDPRVYGGRMEYPGSGDHLPTADRRSLAVVQACHADRIPLLGICRGLHLINVAFGGTLEPHLVNAAFHRGAEGGGEMTSHVVDVLAGTVLAEATGEERLVVRSGHHQAVRNVGEGLRASAWARDDGLIEALEHTERDIIGVQWHPEEAGVAPLQLPPLLDWLARRRAEQ